MRAVMLMVAMTTTAANELQLGSAPASSLGPDLTLWQVIGWRVTDPLCTVDSVHVLSKQAVRVISLIDCCTALHLDS